jgi:hypothetical protein
MMIPRTVVPDRLFVAMRYRAPRIMIGVGGKEYCSSGPESLDIV